MEVAKAEDILRAFLVLGGDSSGKIDYNKIVSLLRNKGSFSRKDAEEFLESDRCRKGRKLDFIELCVSMVATAETLDKILLHHENKTKNGKGDNKKVNSRTFTRRKGSGRSVSSANRNRKAENNDLINTHTESIKGCIFNTDLSIGLCGHRFLLELNESSSVEIIAQSIDDRGCCSPTPVIDILLFIENNEPNKKLVTYSSFVNSEGYCVIKMHLKRGKYLLVPVTLNWKGANDTLDPDELETLTDLDDDNETVLTSECKMALKTVFDCIDLDRNGLLSEEEFDLFIQHICGESTADEWSTVEDNFDSVDGQLTFDGFLSLYKMALVTDFNDVAMMLKKMGLNQDLIMTRGLPFLLTVTAKSTKPFLKPLPVSTFDTLMEEVFRKTTIEQGQCTKIRNMNDLLLYTHEMAHRVTLVIKNQAHCKIRVRLDCRNSENCISHRNNLNAVIAVAPKSSVIGHHLFPSICNQPWSVQCIESLID